MNELDKNLGERLKLMIFSLHCHILRAYLFPDLSLQFASWVDAVILVFSLENEASFQEVYKIYHQLAAHRPVSEIPFIVVGTQGETQFWFPLFAVVELCYILVIPFFFFFLKTR